MPYKNVHSLSQARIDDINENIKSLQREIDSTDDKELHPTLKEEIAYWKREIKKVKKNPTKAVMDGMLL
jgi:predicted  nucleic acid-binding Zn-ribbon protein